MTALVTRIAAIIAGIVVLALLVVFVLLPIFMRSRAVPVAEETPQPAPSGYFQLTDQQWSGLQFARVGNVPFPTVEQTDGTIVQADDTTTQVISPYTGRVTAVYATVGDTVHAGDKLFAVEGSEYAQALNDFETALQTLRGAQVQLRATEQNHAHLVSLGRVGGAASKDVEQSYADLAAAQVAVRNDEIAVALVRSRLRVLDISDREIARLEHTKNGKIIKSGVIVYAPVSGIVTQRTVGVGMYVDSAANGSSDQLFTITGFARVFLLAAVPESSIKNIRPGDELAVHMVAFPQRTFESHVKYVAPTVDPNTHRIFVRAEIDNPSGELKPGMFGNMTITTAPPSFTLAVPEYAVLYEGDTARVWIAGAHKTLALRYIRTGETVDGTVQVLGGVRPGDEVVTSGAVFIDRALRGDQ
jgi:membrane fusion protein, heavy metal efflux system